MSSVALCKKHNLKFKKVNFKLDIFHRSRFSIFFISFNKMGNYSDSYYYFSSFLFDFWTINEIFFD